MSTNLATWSKTPVGKVNTRVFDRKKREEIWTTSHPRSGATWSNRLLSDALNAGLQVQPGYEVQYWGDNWDSNYVIRKTHSRTPLPGPTLYIQRDPRAAMVSAMHYRRVKNMRAMLKNKDKGLTLEEFEGIWGYKPWVESWLPAIHAGEVVYTRYEDLHDNGPAELKRIVHELIGEWLSDERVTDIYERQRFDIALARLGDPHSMWKGAKYTWRDYIDRGSARVIHNYLGDLMIELGYVKNDRWVENQPEEL